MRFYADLHIHSKYSRACSRDCDLEHLTWWAQRKGISLVGTGDFTHPAWYDHLRENLVPAEPGLFRLRPELDRDIAVRHGAIRQAGASPFLSAISPSVTERIGEPVPKKRKPKQESLFSSPCTQCHRDSVVQVS